MKKRERENKRTLLTLHLICVYTTQINIVLNRVYSRMFSLNSQNTNIVESTHYTSSVIVLLLNLEKGQKVERDLFILHMAVILKSLVTQNDKGTTEFLSK